ncbi:MAG: hypothetical protein GWM98_00255, partial [Nitrospinaceae bacterium]|nr:hypothetical protein [Nitrospinaceae bacterium]NIS83634.1 hypothetical protein [Nitrospinaceae bacterium]NIT80424.1 hypothetical protein [Nitrospinaceae bacterium]NIU94825.1 hypothetical protein [Nitrospinaceae bacterium]NIY13418.1 hypothetical protein [Nitrospinaceae bacterium]
MTLHRYNTIIEDDFDATLRFDLSPETMVQILSAKPTRETATANAVRAE